MFKVLEAKKKDVIGDFVFLGLVKPFSTSTNEGNIPFNIDD